MLILKLKLKIEIEIEVEIEIGNQVARMPGLTHTKGAMIEEQW